MIIAKKSIFNKELIKKLPLTYHYMVEMKTDNVAEYLTEMRFSVSKIHFSNSYINKNSFKPLSSILIDQ